MAFVDEGALICSMIGPRNRMNKKKLPLNSLVEPNQQLGTVDDKLLLDFVYQILFTLVA